MKVRTGLLLIVIFALAACGGYYFYFRTLPMSAHDAEYATDISGLYDARKEIDEARIKLADIRPALVIAGAPAKGGSVCVIVEGLPDRGTALRMLEVFSGHKAETVFFAVGQDAQDMPEVVKNITEAGMELGNYTYTGVPRLEQLSLDETLQQLCSTQKILRTLNGRTPVLFCAPRLKLSPELLKVIHACGLDYAVVPDIRVAAGTFKSQADADSFAAAVPPGAIVSFDISEPSEWKKYEPGKTDERPAFDKRPTIKDTDFAGNKPEEVPLAVQADYLLTALKKRGLKFESVRSMRVFDLVPASAPAEKKVKADG